MERIEDTTGFFSPWLSDTTPTSVFYIEEQLHPESYPYNGYRDSQEELKQLVDRLKIEDPRTKVLDQATGKNRVMIRYETFGKNGTLVSKRIECLTFVDDRIIELNYVQYHDLQNELLEIVWTGLREMNVENKK